MSKIKNYLQPLLSAVLIAVCAICAFTIMRQQQGEEVPQLNSYSWAAHPNAIVILQRAKSNCGCTASLSDMALTGLSHGLDVLVIANAEAGEAPELRRANLSKSVSVVMPLAPNWSDRFFAQKQDLVMVRVHNGKIVKVVQNGVPPESFFQ